VELSLVFRAGLLVKIDVIVWEYRARGECCSRFGANNPPFAMTLQRMGHPDFWGHPDF